MQVHIGSAPDSWGVWFPDDEKQTPWNRCLDEIAEAGYEWTELGPYGYLPTDVETLRSELDRRGLKASASFAMAHLEDLEGWPEVERQVAGFGEILQPLGAKFLVLIDDCYTNLFTGDPIKPKQLDADAWKRLIEATHRVGQLAKDRYSLQVVFHPHANTHVEYEDQIEALLDQTDPDLVALCLDTGHHAYCGGDPVAFMRKHHARIPYLHLKSVDRDLQNKVETEGIPFANAVAADMFVEPSQGAVDFLAFLDVLKEIDFHGFGIVEQDLYPAPFDKPLPIAKRTRAYLKEIGMG
jgi:inosose dehydratase